MALPSFDDEWHSGERRKPRIQVLEIRHRDRLDAEPLAWLLVERQETYRRDLRDDSIYEATISLSYVRILPKYSHLDGGRGRFMGSYSKCWNSVSLTSSSTSKGAIFLDLNGLEGQRIGTYLMNEIVTWVKRWPEATVNSVELVSGQSHGDNKERRNRFYEQFGLVFDYADAEHCEGSSQAMQTKKLVSVETWKQNIREHRFSDYLADILYAEERTSFEIERCNQVIANLRADRKKAEDAPIQWVLQRFWWRYSSTIIGGIIVFGLGLFAWMRLRA